MFFGKYKLTSTWPGSIAYVSRLLTIQDKGGAREAV